MPGLTLAPVAAPRAVARPAPAGSPAPASVRRALGPALEEPAPRRPPRCRRPADRRAGARRGPRRVHAGLHPQAPHLRGRPRDARARPHVRDQGRGRRPPGVDAGRWRRPVPARQARDRPGGPRRRQPPGPGRGDGARPDGPRHHVGVARLRHLPVHRPGAEPPLAAAPTSPTTRSHRSRRCGPTRASRRAGTAARPTQRRVPRTSSRASCARAGVARHRTGPRASGADRRARGGAASAAHRSADIVEQILQVSDNEGAEVLARQTGIAVNGHGSFNGGSAAVRQVLTGLGIDLSGATIYDGSGLSRDDRLDAETLVAVLQLASSADHPELRSVITGLPVAAFDGSLEERFDGSPGRGWVRAKTGTLTGTSALAGLVTDARGHAARVRVRQQPHPARRHARRPRRPRRPGRPARHLSLLNPSRRSSWSRPSRSRPQARRPGLVSPVTASQAQPWARSTCPRPCRSLVPRAPLLGHRRLGP